MIKKYQLPDINMSYFISAMDQYAQHFKKENSSSKVSTELWSIDIGVKQSITSLYIIKRFKQFQFKPFSVNIHLCVG